MPKSKTKLAPPFATLPETEQEMLKVLYGAYTSRMDEKQKDYLAAKRQYQERQNTKDGSVPDKPLPHFALYLSELYDILVDVIGLTIDNHSFYTIYAPDLLKRQLIQPAFSKDNIIFTDPKINGLKKLAVIHFPVQLSVAGAEYYAKSKQGVHSTKADNIITCPCGKLTLNYVSGDATYCGTKANFKPGKKEYKIVYGLLTSPTRRMNYDEIIKAFEESSGNADRTNIASIINTIKNKLHIEKGKNDDLKHFKAANGYALTCV